MPASGWGAPCSGEKVTVARSDGVKLPVRKQIAVLVAYLCDETERLTYNLVPGWCWGYSCRKIRGSSTWSNHAWGLAVDLNAPENPRGPRRGKIRAHPRVIALWKRYEFRWGGDYSGTADDMHFEFMGTPADAEHLTQQAIREFRGKPSPVPQGDWLAMANREDVKAALREVLQEETGKLKLNEGKTPFQPIYNALHKWVTKDDGDRVLKQHLDIIEESIEKGP